MSVAFEELEGSPSWSFSKDGFQGQRQFLVAWADQANFLAELFGLWNTIGAQTIQRSPAYFPLFPQALVSNVECQPFSGLAPAGYAGQTLTNGLSSYEAAHFNVTYSSKFGGGGGTNKDRGDLPAVAQGYLSYSGDMGGEYMTVPGRSWKWVGGTERVAEDILPGILIPTDNFTITWHRCPVPPWDTISSLRGLVNSAALLNYGAEQVLFLGCRPSRTFQINDSELWTLEYNFSARTPEGSATFGWNHFYKPGSGWTKIENDASQPPFVGGDLSGLFT